MNKKFGFSSEVFINQDEGTFVAFPYTFAEGNVGVKLETELREGKKYVLAGSIVQEGSTSLGVVPEEYCISDGPVAGRIVVAGYCYVSKLTSRAQELLPSLPNIVAMPCNQIVVWMKELILKTEPVQKVQLVLKVEGGTWHTSIDKSVFTVVQEIKSIVRNDSTTLTLEFDKDESQIDITSVKKDAFYLAGGKSIKGLPISVLVPDQY